MVEAVPWFQFGSWTGSTWVKRQWHIAILRHCLLNQTSIDNCSSLESSAATTPKMASDNLFLFLALAVLAAACRGETGEMGLRREQGQRAGPQLPHLPVMVANSN